MIPTVISQIAAGQKTIRLGALEPTRDFTYVGDTARGFVQLAACDDALGRVTNIGSGFEISIRELVERIAKVMNVDVAIELDKARLRPAASEVDRLFAGTEVAQKLFDWSPEHGGLEGFERGLKKTADWFVKPENLAMYKSGTYAI